MSEKEEIAEETGRDSQEVLMDFLCSKTGKALYDKDKNASPFCDILEHKSDDYLRYMVTIGKTPSDSRAGQLKRVLDFSSTQLYNLLRK